MQQMVKTINNNDFNFRTEENAFVSVLNPGYIITPEGNFIDVTDREDHSQIFSSYLRGYLEKNEMGEKSSIDATKILVKLNHIVYFGIKTSDKVIDSNQKDGLGVLIFPDNMEDITDEQKNSVVDLLKTNKSIFSNNKKIELDITTFNGKNNFLEEELIDSFNEMQKVKTK